MRVALIHDDPAVVASLRALTNQISAVKTTCCVQPDSALDVIAATTPDLIVANVFMGPGSGIDLTRRLRHLPACSGTPIVLLVPPSAGSIRSRCLDAGATDFVTTPIEPDEFVTRLTNLLALVLLRRIVAQQVQSTLADLRRADLAGTGPGRVYASPPRSVQGAMPEMQPPYWYH